MLSSPQLAHVATLVHPEEYERNTGKVVSVYEDRVTFLKARVLGMGAYNFIELPLDRCSSIIYQKRLAVISMLLGAVLIATIAGMLYLAAEQGKTSMPIKELLIGVVFGGVMLRGPRRHQLTFVIDGKKYRWQSRAGDFGYKQVSVQKVLDFARLRGLLSNSKKIAVLA